MTIKKNYIVDTYKFTFNYLLMIEQFLKTSLAGAGLLEPADAR